MEPNNDNPLTSGVPTTHSLPDAGTLPTNGQTGSAAAATLQTQPVAAPQQANDVELIEDEWIDAARRAIASNSGDPHAMSSAVAALRKDYLERRYGKSVETDK